ncbi:MAG: class I SAM-dependent methyltransferase family protein [Gemmatimonadota bacterium]
MGGSRERDTATVTGPFFNRTRTSISIPKRLFRERKLHLLPLYALLRTSNLGREAIESSGSYRFADHVYRGRSHGKLGVGKLLDSVLLRLRATRSMRSRFLHARSELLAAAERHPVDRPFRALSVPCGIARELVEGAGILLAGNPGLAGRTSFIGIDLDPRPLTLSRAISRGLPGFLFIRADALDPRTFPAELDVILSTGLGEFLDDEQLLRFYVICRAALRDGGTFVTSATRREPFSDYLMRELAELRPHYREPDELVRLLGQAGFHDVSARLDDIGLQVLIAARRRQVEPANEPGGTS